MLVSLGLELLGCMWEGHLFCWTTALILGVWNMAVGAIWGFLCTPLFTYFCEMGWTKYWRDLYCEEAYCRG